MDRVEKIKEIIKEKLMPARYMTMGETTLEKVSQDIAQQIASLDEVKPDDKAIRAQVYKEIGEWLESLGEFDERTELGKGLANLKSGKPVDSK
jgi:hypothetical protein